MAKRHVLANRYIKKTNKEEEDKEEEDKIEMKYSQPHVFYMLRKKSKAKQTPRPYEQYIDYNV
jgi:hypothetical protein